MVFRKVPGDYQLAFGRFWLLQCASFAHYMLPKALLWWKEKKAGVLFERV